MYTKLTINGWTRGGLYARREKGLKDRRHKAGGSSTWIAGSSRCAGDSVNPRPGVTLTEVLVAIFIMGIGLLSLLVLFPLGALNMAQAIKDNRATQSCTNAYAAFQMLKTTSGTLLLRDEPTNV